MENDHPKRKSTHLKYFDYSSKGAYFVTICTQDRKELLSEIELAHANSITATPTIIINDINYIGSMTYSQLLTRVKQAHKREKNNKNRKREIYRRRTI